MLRVLFTKNGAVLNQRQIAKAVNASPPGVMKALPLLEKLDYIKLKKIKKQKGGQ
ncbi:winged helix-turn-helix transcriptional regulator [Candidatus Woesearchaeota archaeon]|nr:MAG: winged helix-turn-helix transcriptional regulator [Candidatus Woesearchaeota archaeon]